MTYEEAMTYIQEAGSTGIQLGLSRMRELCRRLGDPQEKLSFIHVAGTNGKGSTAAYISSILGVNGYLVGRYVSPVVFQYEECIQYEDMEGVHPIDRELLAELMTEAADAVESMAADGQERPTVFEIETAVSFLAFVRWRCFVVVLEVGMGGREDATNVIEHVLASVITPISRDHMSVLGGTLAEIASEKAGIIRTNGQVISYQKESEAAGVIAEVCREKGAVLTSLRQEDMKIVSMDLRGSVFSYKGERYRTGMIGAYQIENACLAIATCLSLKDTFPLDPEQLILGIRKAYWRGRFEIVCADPWILVDGAHNESGAKALSESVQKLLPGRPVHGIMGVFKDKEYEKMISVLHPLMQDMIAVTAPGPRGLPAHKLAQAWEKYGMGAVGIADSVMDGLKMAAGRCRENDVILLFGSLSLLGQPYKQSFKTLVMQGKSGEYHVFVLPVDREVDLKKAARTVNEKSLEMVHVKDINTVTGYIRGGCTAIGMKKRYNTVIHESAQDFDRIIINGGRLGSQILLAPEDLARVTGGKFADIAV